MTHSGRDCTDGVYKYQYLAGIVQTVCTNYQYLAGNVQTVCVNINT